MKKLTQPAFGIAGMGLGFGIAGEMFQSPGLVHASQASSKFVAPTVNVSMGAEMIRGLKKLSKENKGKRK